MPSIINPRMGNDWEVTYVGSGYRGNIAQLVSRFAHIQSFESVRPEKLNEGHITLSYLFLRRHNLLPWRRLWWSISIVTPELTVWVLIVSMVGSSKTVGCIMLSVGFHYIGARSCQFVLVIWCWATLAETFNVVPKQLGRSSLSQTGAHV